MQQKKNPQAAGSFKHLRVRKNVFNWRRPSSSGSPRAVSPFAGSLPYVRQPSGLYRGYRAHHSIHKFHHCVLPGAASFVHHHTTHPVQMHGLHSSVSYHPYIKTCANPIFHKHMKTNNIQPHLHPNLPQNSKDII